ncbi:MAG: helix-turn-helix transcriptional regulator [Clostridia bacterium]|nr:helix-turn-helix transcriptional regulator [Clostridia bacterium]
MNLKIGEKIKLLRQRDGRKQEDLANVLGVSPQAVSRWESNGGYPDLELIPAIANYFNISIDELFGCNKERQEKLDAILEKADKAINTISDMTETVIMLRSALKEFPSEPLIALKLGYLLTLLGWKECGVEVRSVKDSIYARIDSECNSQNTYWQEAVRMFERVLDARISPQDHEAAVNLLVTLYPIIGQTDKAKELALKQKSVIVSREALLTLVPNGEERDMYCGEALVAFLTEMCKAMLKQVGNKKTLFKNQIGVDSMIALANYCESVFSDGRCGILHIFLRDLYIYAALFQVRFCNDVDAGIEYFGKGFEHNKAYCAIPRDGEYRFTAPLVSKVAAPAKDFPLVRDSFWKEYFKIAPDELKNRISSDPRFAECFAE